MQNEETKLDQGVVRDAVAALIATDGFSRSARLREFLTYVVEETLAGRGGDIRAKTIAQDVYGRDPSSSGYRENVVRVDARRLRRLLEEYYSGDGADAELRITIATGSYTPRFEFSQPSDNEANSSDKAKHWIIVLRSKMLLTAVGFATVSALIVLTFFSATYDSSSESNLTPAERLALLDRSSASLQAENLCRQGRGMLFPIADVAQQNLATSLFRRAIDLDPRYGCGYAGTAHSLGTLAFLTPEGKARNALVAEALKMAETAQRLDPTDGWTVSGLAWSALAAGDSETAFEQSKLSAELSPTDGNVLDFHGVISVLVGDYEEGRRATDPKRQRDTSGLEHAHHNVYGVASYHASYYEEAIDAFNTAIRLGEPVSALTLIYLTVSHQANGNEQEARNYLRDLQNDYPNFPIGPAVRSFYIHDTAAQKILSHLRDAGWIE